MLLMRRILLAAMLCAMLPAVAWAQSGLGNGTGSTSSMAANVNLTGSDTVSLSGGNQKFTLTANESNAGCTGSAAPDACCTGAGTGTCGLTIQEGALPGTPSTTNLYTTQFEICQNGTGNFQLAFAAGTGVINFEWSGSGSASATVGQPGYTLTAGNADWYACNFDGTSLRCKETMSNQPC